jgi:hypothetical protein
MAPPLSGYSQVIPLVGLSFEQPVSEHFDQNLLLKSLSIAALLGGTGVAEALHFV